jgi:hypothetical protein
MHKTEALRQAQIVLLRGMFGDRNVSANRGIKLEGDEGKSGSGGGATM